MPGATSVGLIANHRYLVKFPSIQHPNYLKVKREIHKVIHFYENSRSKSPIQDLKQRAFEPIEAPKPNYKVPFDTIGLPICPRFIGRNDEMKAIGRYLLPVESAKHTKRVIIHGLGGMGKTQLALNYAIEQSEEYSAFLWVSSKSERSLQDGIALFAERIPLPQVLDKNGALIAGAATRKEALHQVLKWMSLEGNSKWLMVLDNADDQAFANSTKSRDGQGHFDLGQYIPHQGTVIITTRLSDLKTLGHAIELDRVPMQDGLELLCSASDNCVEDDGWSVPSVVVKVIA